MVIRGSGCRLFTGPLLCYGKKKLDYIHICGNQKECIAGQKCIGYLALLIVTVLFITSAWRPLVRSDETWEITLTTPSTSTIEMARELVLYLCYL
jgi:hypothetical protein